MVTVHLVVTIDVELLTDRGVKRDASAEAALVAEADAADAAAADTGAVNTQVDMAAAYTADTDDTAHTAAAAAAVHLKLQLYSFSN